MPERKNEHASMDQMSLFSFPFPLPIDAVLPRVASALEQNTRLILEAAPGAGKTTRVPLALCQAPWLGGRKIVMLEPRRLAARAAARYMARLLGEDAGRTVGYRTALDGRESERTRILVVTEGILTRLIQADPGLKGVGCLIFDEFHERSLNADIGLALSLECQEALRPDLRLVVMSATLDSEPLARLLDPCSRLAVEGRGFPVAVRHLAPARPGLSCEEHALSAIHQALREESGGMLVFLPGAAEIRRTALRLAAASLPRGVVVLPLYGDLSSAAQDAAVVPPAPGERKIVLATNIAESSLTIEGVRIVIDAGFVRRQRMDPALGMNRLVTERVSRDSADQRCGRAGRSEHGLCLRLWPEHEHTALQARTRPDILDSDLASLCLELAVWGVPITDEPPAGPPFLDAPPDAAWRQAAVLLRDLGALDAAGRATARGRAMAGLPLHPRLAHMVLEGAKNGLGLTACALAALLSERDPLRTGDESAAPQTGADVGPRLALLLDDSRADASRPENGLLRRLREQTRRIASRAGIASSPAGRESVASASEAGALLALAWPERVALRRAFASYLMANGRGAVLAPGDPLAAQPCLAVAALDLGGTGNADARIHLAAPLGLEDIERLFADRIVREDTVAWDAERQAVSARVLRRLGALTLSEVPLADPPPDKIKAVLLEALQKMGTAGLPWTPELTTWRRRARFARGLALLERRARDGSPRAHVGAGAGRSASGAVPADEIALADAEWPDMSDAALTATLPDWLGPHLEGIDRLSRLSPALLGEALRGLLPWTLTRRLDELAPAGIAVPSGSRISLDYGDAADEMERMTADVGAAHGEPPGPVLAVKLQELFGLETTPAVGGGRVPVVIHMLSPAGRPVQITRDLGGFWKNGYAAVRADLRGRYPKHPWPEDPLSARPTRHTKKRMQGG